MCNFKVIAILKKLLYLSSLLEFFNYDLIFLHTYRQFIVLYSDKMFSSFFFFFFFFLNIFGGHIHMSYFGATDTPVLDFW